MQAFTYLDQSANAFLCILIPSLESEPALKQASRSHNTESCLQRRAPTFTDYGNKEATFPHHHGRGAVGSSGLIGNMSEASSHGACHHRKASRLRLEQDMCRSP